MDNQVLLYAETTENVKPSNFRSDKILVKHENLTKIQPSDKINNNKSQYPSNQADVTGSKLILNPDLSQTATKDSQKCPAIEVISFSGSSNSGEKPENCANLSLKTKIESANSPINSNKHNLTQKETEHKLQQVEVNQRNAEVQETEKKLNLNKNSPTTPIIFNISSTITNITLSPTKSSLKMGSQFSNISHSQVPENLPNSEKPSMTLLPNNNINNNNTTATLPISKSSSLCHTEKTSEFNTAASGAGSASSTFNQTILEVNTTRELGSDIGARCWILSRKIFSFLASY